MAAQQITVHVAPAQEITVDVEVAQIGGATPPAFVATLRTLSPSDDAPINAYATDLAGYAADIGEAQDLLDAAEAVGTLAEAVDKLEAVEPPFVATLRMMSPGDDAPINTYSSDLELWAGNIGNAQDLLDAAQAVGDVFQAIAKLEASESVTTYTSLDAVRSAGLAEGAHWRVAWGAGALAAPFSAAGEVIGTILNGAPSWIGWLPYELWGTTLSDTTATGGSRTSDSDGRPRLSVTSTSGSSVVTDLGMQTDRPQRARLLARLTAASPSDSTDDLGGLQMRRASTGNALKTYVGRSVSNGGWFAGLATLIGTTTSGLGFSNLDSPTTSTKFASGKIVEFDLSFVTGNLAINAVASTVQPDAETRKAYGPASNSIIGDGGSANNIDIRVYLQSAGAAMTLDLLAVQISGPPTRG